MLLSGLHCNLSERYYQLSGEGTRTWVKAERFYKQALQLLPDNGNPHNQLAVVATYTNNNLAAVHRYVRSYALLLMGLYPATFVLWPCTDSLLQPLSRYTLSAM